ncbi:MAG: hypothetical protein RIU67_1731 [Actinomycetota bacterium]
MALGRPSIADLKRGEANAWKWFVDEFASTVTGYARRAGHSDPEEVTGSTLETIAKKIAQFEGGHSELRSYVFSVAHARIVDDIRRRSRRQEVAIDWSTQAAGEEQATTFASADTQLLDALATLPDETRQMLELRYVVGLSTKETARAIGKSEVATRVALSRSMTRLREVLGSEGVAS